MMTDKFIITYQIKSKYCFWLYEKGFQENLCHSSFNNFLDIPFPKPIVKNCLKTEVINIKLLLNQINNSFFRFIVKSIRRCLNVVGKIRKTTRSLKYTTTIIVDDKLQARHIY